MWTRSEIDIFNYSTKKVIQFSTFDQSFDVLRKLSRKVEGLSTRNPQNVDKKMYKCVEKNGG